MRSPAAATRDRFGLRPRGWRCARSRAGSARPCGPVEHGGLACVLLAEPIGSTLRMLGDQAKHDPLAPAAMRIAIGPADPASASGCGSGCAAALLEQRTRSPPASHQTHTVLAVVVFEPTSAESNTSLPLTLATVAAIVASRSGFR